MQQVPSIDPASYLSSDEGGGGENTVSQKRLQLYHGYELFDPAAYITEYYSDLGAENRFLLEFYHRIFQQIPAASLILEFGGGPTVYQLLSARKKAQEIIFAEYLPANRREVEKWLRGSKDAYNWDSYLDFVLQLENRVVSAKNRERLRNELSPKVTQIIECDAYSRNVLGPNPFACFDVVSSSFCLECISNEEALFLQFLSKVDCLLRPRGLLVLTMLKKAKKYQVGNLVFPAFSLDERYIKAALINLGYHWISVESVFAEKTQGYEGLIALSAEKC